MKIDRAASYLGLVPLTPCEATEFCGVYAGDFLWITIMNNVNVVAVASLTDAAAVVLAENVGLAPEVLEAARAKGVAVFSSDKTVYELCALIGAMDDE